MNLELKGRVPGWRQYIWESAIYGLQNHRTNAAVTQGAWVSCTLHEPSSLSSFLPPSQTPTPFMIAQLQVVLLQAPFSSSLSHVMALTRFCFQLMAAHLSILAWRIPWTGEPGRLQSMGSQRVKHDWRTNTSWLFYLYLLYETLSQESHMEASDFLFSLPGNGTSFLHPCSCLSIFI